MWGRRETVFTEKNNSLEKSMKIIFHQQKMKFECFFAVINLIENRLTSVSYSSTQHTTLRIKIKARNKQKSYFIFILCQMFRQRAQRSVEGWEGAENKKKIIVETKKSLWKPQNRFLKMFMRHFWVYESCRHIKSEHSRVRPVQLHVRQRKKNQNFPLSLFSHRSSSHVISHLLNFHSYLFRTSRVAVNLVPLKTASLLSARRAESCPVGVAVIRHKNEVYTRKTLKSCVKTEAKK